MLINRLPAHKKSSQGPLKLYHSFSSPLSEELPSKLEDVVQTAVALARPLLAHLHCVVVTLGSHGVLLCGKNLGGSISLCPGAHEQVKAWKTNSALRCFFLGPHSTVAISGGMAAVVGNMASLLANVHVWGVGVGVEYTTLKENQLVCPYTAGS